VGLSVDSRVLSVCWGNDIFSTIKEEVMFEWIKDTGVGKAMKEISDVFQPAYDDIEGWENLTDIGKFSDKTMKEFKEAWAVVPKGVKKDLYKAYRYILKHAPAIAVEVVKLFFQARGIKVN
jgi:hypothetical protein